MKFIWLVIFPKQSIYVSKSVVITALGIPKKIVVISHRVEIKTQNYFFRKTCFTLGICTKASYKSLKVSKFFTSRLILYKASFGGTAKTSNFAMFISRSAKQPVTS